MNKYWVTATLGAAALLTVAGCSSTNAKQASSSEQAPESASASAEAPTGTSSSSSSTSSAATSLTVTQACTKLKAALKQSSGANPTGAQYSAAALQVAGFANQTPSSISDDVTGLAENLEKASEKGSAGSGQAVVLVQDGTSRLNKVCSNAGVPFNFS